jgi:serine/threonine protein kinase
MSGGVGTQAYTAPEVLINANYDPSVDMWSIGATIFTLLSGTKPFDYGPSHTIGEIPTAEQRNYQKAKILNGDYNFEDPIWEKISSNARDFLTNLMKVRPADRISAKAALEHPWIKSVDIDLRSFNYQWKLNSRNRREAARREKREKRLTERASTRNNPTETTSRDYGSVARREKARSTVADLHSTPKARDTDSYRIPLSSSLTPSYSSTRERERERASERANELLTERTFSTTSRSSERPKIDRSALDRTSSTRERTTERGTSNLRSTASSTYRSEQTSPLSRSIRADARSTTSSSEFQTTRKYR